MRPFTVSQVEEYVRKAHPKDAVSVLTKTHKIYNLRELSQRPLLLEMIVKSIDKLGSGDVNAADLYGVFTNAWIHRDRWRDLMRPEDKLKFLTALARSLWEQERTIVLRDRRFLPQDQPAGTSLHWRTTHILRLRTGFWLWACSRPEWQSYFCGPARSLLRELRRGSQEDLKPAAHPPR